MKRGYLKFWRRAQDSVSWNRGLLYQGLMINLLLRAAWEPATYLGVALEPGEFGVVLARLSEELGLSRTNGRRMIAQLETDGFLKVRNVGNRFSVISITNWEGWQEEETCARSTAGQPDDALAVDQRSTGVASFYNEEEKEKEKRKSEEGERAPAPEHPCGGNFVSAGASAAAPASAPAAPPGLGECGNVRLTQKERASLEERYGADLVTEAIDLLDQAIEAKGCDSWRSHAAAMKKWVFDAVRERRARRARCAAAQSMPGEPPGATRKGRAGASSASGTCGAGGGREASPLALRNLATAQAVLRARAGEGRP